jgi:type I restriction enzyme S subunit
MLRLRGEVSPLFVYLWLRWLYAADTFLQYENSTSGIKNFAFSIFSKQYGLVIPPLEILKQFEF